MPCDTSSSTNVILFVSGATVAILTHFLASLRESKNRRHADDLACKARKTNLLGLLKVWCSQVEANRPVYIAAANLSLTTPQLFDERRLELIRAATPIESDFRDEKLIHFKAFVDAITDITPGQLDNEQGRKKLLAAINDLIGFVKTN